MRLVGYKQQEQVDPLEVLNTISEIQSTMANLDTRLTALESIIRSELESAIEKKRRNDKRAALECLNKKKRYEADMAKLDAEKMKLEQRIFFIEEFLRSNNNQEKFFYRPPAHVPFLCTMQHSSREDSAEQIDEEEDISDALVQPTDDVMSLNEEELLKELDQLEATEMEEKSLILKLPATGKTPEAK